MFFFLWVHKDIHWHSNSWRETGGRCHAAKGARLDSNPDWAFRNVACSLPGHPEVFLFPSWLRVRSRKSLLCVRSQSLMSETDITTKRIHSQSVTHLRGSVGENWQKEGCASPFVRGDVLCMRTKQSITQQPSNIHLKTIFIFFLSLTSISARLLWHLTQTSRNEIKGFAEIISPRRVA